MAKRQEWYDKPIDTNTSHIEGWGVLEWLERKDLFLINKLIIWSTGSNLRAADCQSFVMCLIPSFLSVISPSLDSWMQGFGGHIHLSLSSCLVSPFSSACLTSLFSLFSPGKILLWHRRDSPGTAFIWMVCGGKKDCFSVNHYHGPLFSRTSFVACYWLWCCV